MRALDPQEIVHHDCSIASLHLFDPTSSIQTIPSQYMNKGSRNTALVSFNGCPIAASFENTDKVLRSFSALPAFIPVSTR